MQKLSINYVSIYIFSYVALGVLLPLLGQYLKSLGFSGLEIGTITSAGTAVAILSSAFWGNIYNNSTNKKKLVCRLCVAAAVVCAFEPFVQRYIFFLFIFSVIYLFQSPIMAFVDAMAIEDGQPFAAARKWGSIGYALAVFLASKLAEILGLVVIFPLYSCSFLICAGIVYIMSKRSIYDKRPHQVSKVNEKRIKAEFLLLRNKEYVKIVICAFFICGTTIANNIYFGFLYTENGGNIAGIGVAFLLMAGSEAPFMAWSKKLADRFTLEKMILVSMCISVLRFFWYATGPSHILLLMLFFLQGMVYGIVLVEFIRYIAKVVIPDNLGMAISVYYGISSSLSAIFCQLLGGIILDYRGIGGVYFFFASLNLMGVIIYIASGLYKAKQ